MTSSVAAAGLAAQLRDGTRAEHEAAEGTAFVGALLAGAVPLDGYVAYLGQLYHVYEALEGDRSAVAEDPTARGLLHPGLDRITALADDLLFLAGPSWRSRCVPARTTRAYTDRITRVRTTWPGGYVAHHYTRYLGDLSGGQVIAGALRRHYDLTGEEGTRFFAFDEIGSAKRFKDAYRATLDGAPWDAPERARIVDEARIAFRHNRNLLVHVEQHWTRTDEREAEATP